MSGEARVSDPLPSRKRVWWEIAIVLGLSLGQSAVYSVIDIVAALTAPTPIGEQTTALNPSQSPREWLDFTYQFAGVVFAFAPVALALWLLWQPAVSGFRRIGLDWRGRRAGRDIGGGFALLAIIGIPGIALYAVGRMLGFTIDVQAAPLAGYWWTIPMLVLSALRSAAEEEVIVIGYLFTRLRELGWRGWWIIAAAALLRGSYHLYQGFGSFVGNAVMGVVFGWVYRRWGRVLPLVVAHLLLDVISFVGYPLAVQLWPGVF
ncbi:CPBP family intramembrane glutamic endopeptidase [Gryllotalpicola sp.]|uniref:CPBP family intramembrane glutamic endopeptidase n=1 Tax=Gryllotalpicola sp. TaxID=1932787 RepID=UPI00262C54EF|nr:CPBP family intramembrane glutamic endopeptidase [Gryllotalpicola sp.]